MHTIRLHIEGEQALYNAFDPEGELLADDVKAYILDRMRERSPGEGVELELVTPGPIDQARAQRAFQRWVEEEEQLVRAECRRNMLQQLWMFGVGVLFVVVSLMLEAKVGDVWFTILSTIGAFSLWEASSIWIVQNPKLRLHKRVIDKLKHQFRLRFVSAE